VNDIQLPNKVKTSLKKVLKNKQPTTFQKRQSARMSETMPERHDQPEHKVPATLSKKNFGKRQLFKKKVRIVGKIG